MTVATDAQVVRSLYEQLIPLLQELMRLEGVMTLLSWDENVMMPKKAAAARGNQTAAMAAVVHEKETSSKLGSILDQLRANPALTEELTDYEQANVRLASTNYKSNVLIPKDLVEAKAQLSSTGLHAWVGARKDNDFSQFAPSLKAWVELNQRQAQLLIDGGVSDEATRLHQKAAVSLEEGQVNRGGYYQVLFEKFETGFKDERLQVLFNDLKAALVPLIAKIREKNFQHENAWLKKDFDTEAQKTLSHRLSKEIGFDTDAGRLDVSVHPFTTGNHPTDVRMTTRYTAGNLKEGIMATIHETGHSLYEQGRNPDQESLPVSQALSLGVHESQSLLWERMVGLSKPFWTYALPLLQDTFSKDFHAGVHELDINGVYHAFNRVEPGLIRVQADELSYPLHIITRYEIEKGLIEGKIQVEDVPTIWNAKIKEYLGVEVTKDSEGCLQDIHWSMGMMSYFPTYTLGSIYAVQIFRQAQKDLPELEEDLKKGNFKPLKEYLNKNVHVKGAMPLSGDELIQQLTGGPLDSSLYVSYLTEKYTQIYNL